MRSNAAFAACIFILYLGAAQARVATGPLGPVGSVATVLLAASPPFDGDTIKVKKTPRARTIINVRLACLDAPERYHFQGLESVQALSALIPAGSALTARVTQAKDRYGRVVAEITNAPTGINVNLAMVAQGRAFVQPAYVGNCDAAAFMAAEASAKANRLGLWGVDGMLPPWECRKNQTLCKPSKVVG